MHNQPSDQSTTTVRRGPPDAARHESILKIEIPSLPQSMVDISIALAEDEPDLATLSRIISRDMALSSAIMRTLNSPLFALTRKVRNVQDAITYLGYREVAAQTFQHSLRSAFPPSKPLDLIMGRATLRALVMGRLAQLLDMPDPWVAHASGIFEECGKAVLLRVHGDSYARLLTKHASSCSDEALRDEEFELYGIGHEELSAMLCAKWGVADEACRAIHCRIETVSSGALPPEKSLRNIGFLQIVAARIMCGAEHVVDAAVAYAPQIERSEAMVARMVQKIVDQVQAKE